MEIINSVLIKPRNTIRTHNIQSKEYQTLLIQK